MTTMSFDDLEQAYACLAEAIDVAGPEFETLFLTKLALALAHQIGDLDKFKLGIRMALDEAPKAASTAYSG